MKKGQVQSPNGIVEKHSSEDEIENDRKNFFSLFNHSSSLVCVFKGSEHIIETMNESCIKSFGFNATGLPIKFAQSEATELHHVLDKVYSTGRPSEFIELPIILAGQIRYFNVTFTPKVNLAEKVNGVMMLAFEVTDQVLTRYALVGQREALEMILNGTPLQSVLQKLISTTKTQMSEFSRAAIWLIDDDGKNLIKGATFNLSNSFCNQVQSAQIGPDSAACSKVAYFKQPLFIGDLKLDPSWERFQDTPEYKELKSCWASPIISANGRILGVFALYYNYRHLAICKEKGFVELITRTAAVVIEKHRSQAELESAKLHAELASATKSTFLANMSHEIRTPLGIILGFAKLLKESNLPKRQQEGYVNVIERNSCQLLKIVDEILDLAKVEAGKMSIELIDFSFADLLNDVLTSMRLKAAEKNIEFVFKPVTELPKVINSDPTRIRQILNNVLGNAIKFTNKGQVEFRVSFETDLLEFEVEDSGCGIKCEDQKKLFQVFKQADESITRRFGGTGLGLVLTRKLTEALNGNFWLKESQPGIGSTFVVQIKAVKAEKCIESVMADFAEMGIEELDLSEQLRGKRVLLVEDCKDNQDLFSIFLNQQGATVKLADDGQEGIDRAMSEEFDVVLMDVQMPKLDGISAVNRLRAGGYKKPVIALTAHAMKEERDACMRAGFSDFLSKPFNREDLIAKIQHQLH